MPQLIALEWNDNEARVAVASKYGNRIVIEQAFLIPLQPPSETGSSEQYVGQQIAEALTARGIGPIEALVAVGRDSVELRQLQLPAATDEELPEMVRLQAILEFNELDEKWLLDFMPIDESGKGSRNVLAAAIAPQWLQRIEAVCQQHGLKIQHLVLRSCAAAALLARAQPAQRGQVQLLVEMFADQADLTVAIDGKAIFLRTIRRISEPSHLQCLVGGIRLTMAAMQNQFDDRKVVRIVLCGRGEADAALTQQIEKETQTPTVLFDPFAGLELGHSLRIAPIEQPNRFAAVLGMLVSELDQTGHAIDFLNPRRPIEPTAPHKKWKIVAAVASLFLLVYFVYGRIAYFRLQSEVSQLEARADAADKILNSSGNKNLAAAKEISRWADGEIVCLDQLRTMSEHFPPAKKILLSRVTLLPSSVNSGGETFGKLHLEGWAQDNDAITAMEESLRTSGSRVDSSKTSEDHSTPPYSLKFNTTMLIGRESKP